MPKTKKIPSERHRQSGRASARAREGRGHAHAHAAATPEPQLAARSFETPLQLISILVFGLPLRHPLLKASRLPHSDWPFRPRVPVHAVSGSPGLHVPTSMASLVYAPPLPTTVPDVAPSALQNVVAPLLLSQKKWPQTGNHAPLK